jgi:hypothetical protein
MDQEKSYVATIGRVRTSVLYSSEHIKPLESVLIMPLDATEVEMNGKLKTITQDRIVDRVFPTHYPSDEKVYYSDSRC